MFWRPSSMPTLLDFSLRFSPGGVYFWPTFFFPKQTETLNRTPTIRTRLLSPNDKIALYWRFSGTSPGVTLILMYRHFYLQPELNKNLIHFLPTFWPGPAAQFWSQFQSSVTDPHWPNRLVIDRLWAALMGCSICTNGEQRRSKI